jgi:bifunctional non-homologous end joining protein LigD
MSLEEYQKKRDFDQTAEPEAGKAQAEKGKQSAEEPLRFVVQKHRASHLHYDLRLELDGVLISWAVPKGPSLDPADRKLAMQTEDHPFEYRNFEGVIAEGNYGAGEMLIWDEGTYHAPGKSERAESEQVLREGLERGNLKFILDGQKLKGEFALVRMKDESGRQWLLIKKEDEHASAQDIIDLDYSVRSGATIENIRKNEQPLRTARGTINPAFLEALAEEGAQKGPLPTNIEPMLSTLTAEPFDRQGWLYEIKWDGYRAIAEVRRKDIRLYSRNQLDFSEMFPPVMRDLYRLDFEAVLDGEIVAVDEGGRSRIKLLQHYRTTGQGVLVYYLFDLLYLQGWDLRAVPLLRRKQILKQLIPSLTHIKYSDHVENQGAGLYRAARESDVEGIIAKDSRSRYRTGVRSTDWLKIKAYRQQEAVIGGFTEPRGSRRGLGAVLLGVYEGKDLVYVGHTGGGFGEEDLAEVTARLEGLERKNSPFKKKPKTNTPATWVDPVLVCEVRFIDWSKDNLMFQPIFLGLREDKDPRQVRRETAVPSIEALEQSRFPVQEDESETREIGGKPVKLSNLSKPYWPKEGYTKGDMIAYYRSIAAHILPYLQNRPISLHRFPDGIEGKSFFQKDFDNTPEWVKTVKVESESQGAIDYLVCEDEAHLVYMANLGSIELHPWNSNLDDLDKPDYLVIDLDPDVRPFEQVIQTALVVREVVDEIHAPAFPKTSGQSGMHIYIPLGGKYSYEQARQFTHLVCQLINRRLPDLTTLERSPIKRDGKIYLDYLQNRRGQTLVAPYSLRPRPAAPVSAALRWEEVQPGLSPLDFHMKNMEKRISELGDLWKEVLGRGIDMEKSLDLLKKAQW